MTSMGVYNKPAREHADAIATILEQSGVNLMDVSRASGVAYNTIRAIANREGNPTVDTLDKITAALWTRDRSCKRGSCLNCKHLHDHCDGWVACELYFNISNGHGSDVLKPCMMYAPREPL